MGNRESFKVGDWTVDPDLNRITSSTQQVTLRPQAMELLVFLAEQSPEVVSIDEIIESVWHGKPMTTGSVYNCLNELRQAFGDDAQNPSYIETIARRGYRLIATVVSDPFDLAPGEEALQRSETPVPGQRKGYSSRTWMIVLGAVSLGTILIVALLQSTNRETATPVGEPDKSIAVLPFEDLSPAGDNSFFTDGIHGELLTRLARISTLKVISRTSVLPYRNTDKSLPEIARELSVATVLEGGIQQVGNQVRINVQLIDAFTDEHLWAEIYDREMTAENLFAIQSEISTKIAEALDAELSPAEVSRIYDLPTSSLDAYNHYLRGRQIMAKRREIDLAKQEFELAVEIDPEFALAWVGIADTFYLLSSAGVIDSDESRETLRSAVETALAINDQLGEAYTSLAMTYDWDLQFDEAEAAFLKSIELSPGYSQAYQWYALLLPNTPGNLQEKLKLLYKAAQLDPLSLTVQLNIGGLLQELGRYDDAMDKYRNILQIDPGFSLAYRNIGFLQMLNGQLAEAVQSFNRTLEFEVPRHRLLLVQTLILLSMGDLEAIMENREEIIQLEQAGALIKQAATISKIILDYQVNLAQFKPGEALAVLERTPEDLADDERIISAKVIAHLANGDLERARLHFLHLEPKWADPNQWQQLINIAGEMPGACAMAGIFIGTGDEAMGNDLLGQAVHFREEVLPRLVQDSHIDSDLVVCYLLSGAYEKALDFYEQRVAHGHVFDWWQDEKLPWWEPVRKLPRYVDMVFRIEELLAEQRSLLQEIVESESDN